MEEYIYSENDLRINLNELAHELIRELYIAAKKVSVYSLSHPLTQKAVGRPFMLMEKIFHYKKYCSLHLNSGNLYVLNIKMRSSVFSEQIIEYMQILDIRDILFEYGSSADQLNLFLERFVKRLAGTDYQNLMTTHLEKHKISTIHVNSSAGQALFDNGHKFQGDIIGDFSVRNIAGVIMGSDFARLADMLADENLNPDQYLLRYHHDFHPRLIKHLVPEKIAVLEADQLVELLTERAKNLVFPEMEKTAAADVGVEKMRHLVTALNYHPEREEILKRLGTVIVGSGLSSEDYSDIMPQSSAIKLESSEKIDKFLNDVFGNYSQNPVLTDFQEHFGRLLRTGQQGKARAVINLLTEYLSGNDLDRRRNALMLLELALESHGNLTGTFLMEHMIAQIDHYLKSGRETFEFSDLMWKISSICLAEKRYEYLSSLCTVLSQKCERRDGIVTYNSFAIKKAITELNRREIINQLVWELIEGRHTEFQHIKNILITIGSEETALSLSTIISHESRQVRQYALKILAELGKSSLNVFSRIMEDNSYFERDENRRELPEARWYIIRNSIFVLGTLGDPEACRPLRIRLTDPDTRIRRAIVSALEKIGGEQAVDLLLIMADDSDREIREAAVIALGLVGHPENATELISLAYKNKSEAINIIATLGRLGGEEAGEFLGRLLTDTEILSELTSNRSSRDELKLTTIKALGKIGDKGSIAKIRKFNESLSASQKIFFGGSKLNKAAEDILNRNDK